MTGSRMRRPHGQLLKWKQFQNPFTPTRKCAQRMKSQTMNHCNTMMQVYKCSALARSLVQFPARPSYSQPGFDLFLPGFFLRGTRIYVFHRLAPGRCNAVFMKTRSRSCGLKIPYFVHNFPRMFIIRSQNFPPQLVCLYSAKCGANLYHEPETIKPDICAHLPC